MYVYNTFENFCDRPWNWVGIVCTDGDLELYIAEKRHFLQIELTCKCSASCPPLTISVPIDFVMYDIQLLYSVHTYLLIHGGR